MQPRPPLLGQHRMYPALSPPPPLPTSGSLAPTAFLHSNALVLPASGFRLFFPISDSCFAKEEPACLLSTCTCYAVSLDVTPWALWHWDCPLPPWPWGALSLAHPPSEAHCPPHDDCNLKYHFILKCLGRSLIFNQENKGKMQLKQWLVIFFNSALFFVVAGDHLHGYWG